MSPPKTITQPLHADTNSDFTVAGFNKFMGIEGGNATETRELVLA